MDKLPPEIINTIVSFLPVRDESGALTRPSLAAVSRTWQQSVEPFTFSGPFKVKSDQFDSFKQAVPPPSSNDTLRHRRCSLLKQLHVDIILPSYSDEDCAKYEMDQDRATNARVARACVSDLLEMLSEWPAGGDLSLELAIYSLMDPGQCGRTNPKEQRRAFELGQRDDLFAQRFRYSYIDLMDHQEQSGFPSVPCVTSFEPVYYRRQMDPRSLVALTAAFPRLKSVEWTHQMAWPFIALQRQHMQQFADAISTYNLPQSCKDLRIKFEPEYSVPDNKRLPDFSREDFCGALRALIGRSPHLEQFDYEGPIDPSLFWPSVPLDAAAVVHDEAPWPSSLTNVNLVFFKYNFWGQWYFGETSHDGAGRYALDQNGGPLPLAPATREHLPPGYYGDPDELSSTSSIASFTTAETGHERALSLLNEMKMLQESFGDEPEICRNLPRNATLTPLLAAVARQLAHSDCTASALGLSLYSVHLPYIDGTFSFEYVSPGKAFRDVDNLILEDGREVDHHGDNVQAAVETHRRSREAERVSAEMAALRNQDPSERARVAIQFQPWKTTNAVLSSLEGGAGGVGPGGGEDVEERLMDLFHDIGKDRCGHDGIVVVIPFEFW